MYGTGPLANLLECSMCGVGRYSTVYGATSADVCVACGAGKYSILLWADTVSFLVSFPPVQVVWHAWPYPMSLCHPLDAVVVLYDPAVVRDVVWYFYDG